MDILSSISNKLKKAGVSVALVALLSVSLAACGGQDQGTSGSQPAATTAATAMTQATTPGTPATTDADATPASTGSAQEVNLKLTEWAIEPKTVEVKAGKVKFIVTNEGKFTHNAAFSIEGQSELGKTPNFKKDDGPKTIELDLKPGTYKMLCDITGHADKGMVGTLTVK